MTARYRPIVLITCSHTEFAVPGIGPLYHHTVFERYVDAVASTLDCTPLLLPALSGHSEALADCIRLADGALLTGDASNVGPEIYGGASAEETEKRDPHRDETVLPFVRAAIADGLPLLGICRGLQEINVALGGTLYQRVHDVPGRLDHRAPRSRTFTERYLPAHRLNVRKGVGSKRPWSFEALSQGIFKSTRFTVRQSTHLGSPSWWKRPRKTVP